MRMWLPLLLFLFLHLSRTSGAASKWQTLRGDPPMVIARGGLSGLFPDSTEVAYNAAAEASDTTLWCDVQITKSKTAVCAPNVDLSVSTNINTIYPNQNSTYSINGASTNGWFSVDFTDKQLATVFAVQGIKSRIPNFDSRFPLIHVDQFLLGYPDYSVWLNFQHDLFFREHKLNATAYLLDLATGIGINYISSPEVGFLKGIGGAFKGMPTKLVFSFPDGGDVEPTTKQTYASFLKDLSSVKAFASGILVPKSYIWPADASNYLKPHTSLVSDAHKLGLEVFATDFANDFALSYNYSYDPDSEVLYYINNGEFSVDGIISDFPTTPVVARDCLAHLGRSSASTVEFTIVSKNGASGDFPGATDLAFKQAIDDGANFIDCSVQISADKIPFCMPSINLANSSNALQSPFGSITLDVPELNGVGIYSFSLNWSQIQTLTPTISNPYSISELYRNPAYKNAGKFVTLANFLTLANASNSLSGVAIIIENSRYLFSKGIAVDTIVVDAVKKAGIEKKVRIHSSDSALLKRLTSTGYELVYHISDIIGGVAPEAVKEIQSFAQSVVVSKGSVISQKNSFLETFTEVVQNLVAGNLSVYVGTFRNEFFSQAWDFRSDATIEIHNFFARNITGIVTEFPKTAARYKRNLCFENYAIPLLEAGGLLKLVNNTEKNLTFPPMDTLTEEEVAEPPLTLANDMGPAQAPAFSPKGSSGSMLRCGGIVVWVLGSILLLI